MHLIVCIDDRYGLSFSGRRLSSDIVVTEYILSVSAHSRLWIAPYSTKLLNGGHVCVSEDYLAQCEAGAYCFVERDVPQVSKEKLESVTLCCWNRRYPATEHFSRDLLGGMHLVSTEDFPGNSHEKITVERYMP